MENAETLTAKVTALTAAVTSIAEAQSAMNAKLDDVRGYINSLFHTAVLTQEQADLIGSNLDAAVQTLATAMAEATANLTEADSLDEPAA